MTAQETKLHGLVRSRRFIEAFEDSGWIVELRERAQAASVFVSNSREEKEVQSCR